MSHNRLFRFVASLAVSSCPALAIAQNLPNFPPILDGGPPISIRCPIPPQAGNVRDLRSNQLICRRGQRVPDALQDPDVLLQSPLVAWDPFALQTLLEQTDRPNLIGVRYSTNSIGPFEDRYWGIAQRSWSVTESSRHRARLDGAVTSASSPYGDQLAFLGAAAYEIPLSGRLSSVEVRAGLAHFDGTNQLQDDTLVSVGATLRRRWDGIGRGWLIGAASATGIASTQETSFGDKASDRWNAGVVRAGLAYSYPIPDVQLLNGPSMLRASISHVSLLGDFMPFDDAWELGIQFGVRGGRSDDISVVSELFRIGLNAQKSSVGDSISVSVGYTF